MYPGKFKRPNPSVGEPVPYPSVTHRQAASGRRGRHLTAAIGLRYILVATTTRSARSTLAVLTMTSVRNALVRHGKRFQQIFFISALRLLCRLAEMRKKEWSDSGRLFQRWQLLWVSGRCAVREGITADRTRNAALQSDAPAVVHTSRQSRRAFVREIAFGRGGPWK